MALARKALAALVAAVLLATAVQAAFNPPRVYPGPDVVRMIKGIVKRMSSTGGPVTYVENSGTYAMDANGPWPNRLTLENATGLFVGAAVADQKTLVDSYGDGVVLSTAPVVNLELGTKYINTDSIVNPAGLDPLLLSLTPVGWNWDNGIALDFNITAPAGELSFPFAFCTTRNQNAYGSTYDAAMISIGGPGLANRINIAKTAPRNDADTNVYITVYQRFSFDPIDGQPGDNFNLSTDITRCVNNAEAKVDLEGGTYNLRISVQIQNSIIAPAGQIVQAYLLLSAGTQSMDFFFFFFSFLFFFFLSLARSDMFSSR